MFKWFWGILAAIYGWYVRQLVGRARNGRTEETRTVKDKVIDSIGGSKIIRVYKKHAVKENKTTQYAKGSAYANKRLEELIEKRHEEKIKEVDEKLDPRRKKTMFEGGSTKEAPKREDDPRRP